MLILLLSSADFFSKSTFFKKSFMNTIRVLYGLGIKASNKTNHHVPTLRMRSVVVLASMFLCACACSAEPSLLASRVVIQTNYYFSKLILDRSDQVEWLCQQRPDPTHQVKQYQLYTCTCTYKTRVVLKINSTIRRFSAKVFYLPMHKF